MRRFHSCVRPSTAWAEAWPKICPNLVSAPEVLGVGDLHVDNFGTWRDVEGRLIWGVNDFDEACRLPYTADLVRLATSTHLAIEVDDLPISPADACTAILKATGESLGEGGRPFVLAEHHPELRAMAVERFKRPERFWNKLNALPSVREEVPRNALKALRQSLHNPNAKCRVVHRTSGLGSLGRHRYAALAVWRGGYTAREVKELTDSAWLWAQPGRNRRGILCQELLDNAVRCPDPFVITRGRWIVRRLAPDCSRIELSSLPRKRDAARLLEAMGWETANIHLGTMKHEVLARDLDRRRDRWLHNATMAMVKSVHNDWDDWRDCARGTSDNISIGKAMKPQAASSRRPPGGLAGSPAPAGSIPRRFQSLSDSADAARRPGSDPADRSQRFTLKKLEDRYRHRGCRRRDNESVASKSSTRLGLVSA